ncbi:MAG: hypothetical protein JGK24_27405 [Microcoleus sp. PH2017_29_MFU_D_A]|jgi:hypothetical protein|uniref:MOSC domain-containing protein n=1 Tax=unclassified Microcoleus TaxID=2642155 RepID=UPI001D3BC032|nr:MULTISPECIES: hypothetical protein [unclassified Microcoleus]MCC3420046.1 hypothetical protein [Microcoleus sp. PH2017_07_MST_O_A]MCC3429409.1 hypothetical protein [Microcoleus sp. PH2017_04_SCI_O_A]MCC3441710.1 hypothetical protein [Microcoleus sp. PH2017_03_ELD_O_A]MCC3467268.1 hypothetical protein [Microcoleus sp. PH2017_06_SFM_O_A]MCC3506707.1 hypothetical protein [Microcoleus sp. PH2017_19_SFW_U_A]MCC3511616.1 hypothetical protein [Microcoleus sp. PH2017_17_BER_D_A]
MKLISVCVGLPREVTWKRKQVTTGIFKQPVAGRVMMRSLNLDGDKQADLTVHGGAEKAVYAYPIEHYAYWKQKGSWLYGANCISIYKISPVQVLKLMPGVVRSHIGFTYRIPRRAV